MEMASKVYLSRSENGISTELFEANNNLPFLWLFLLDENSVRDWEKSMKEVSDMPEEDYDKYLQDGGISPDIKVPKAVFQKNVKEGRIFFEKSYPHKIKLYDDFMNYLSQGLTKEGSLEVSLAEIADFNSINDLAKELYEDIQTIKSGAKDKALKHSVSSEGDIFTGWVGYDRYLDDEFKNHSGDYMFACNSEDSVNVTKEKNYEEQKKNENVRYKGQTVFMMVFCMIFFLGAIYSLISKSFTYEFLIYLLFGIVCAVYVGLRLKKKKI